MTIFVLRIEARNKKDVKRHNNIIGWTKDVSGNPQEHHLIKYIERRTPEQARKLGERKYGHVVSVRKLEDKALPLPEILPQTKPSDIVKLPNPFPNAMAMDEMIWKRSKNRRKVRRDNMLSEKEELTKE